MEGIKPNASWVVGIWLEEDTVFAVHWDGFTSRFCHVAMRVLFEN
jgi:hypothetical protein